MADHTPVSPRSSLDDALHFDQDDLSANREGRLSAAQVVKLRRTSRRTLIFGIIAIIVIGLVATVLIFLGQQHNSMVLNVIGVILTVLNAAVVGFLVQNWLRLQSDLTQPVTMQEGLANRTLRISGRTPTYIVKFDNVNIFVNKIAFNAFIEGAAYKLYRSAGTKTVLSAELVGMIDN